MPTDKDFKRKIRTRMAKTGESYTAARAQLMKASQRPKRTDAPAGPSPAEYATIAGMRDAAVEAKTGRTWAGWVEALDAVDAHRLEHKEIARLLRERFDVGAWWAQSVTGGYERIKGLRAKHQVRGGKFEVSKSKTVPVPIARLYKAFSARERARWLTDGTFTVKTSSVNKSMRLTWQDGTPVDVYFWEKGAGKSQVQLQHRELADASAVEASRAAWAARVASLAAYLKS